jgi:predicted ATPase with chaperone activity
MGNYLVPIVGSGCPAVRTSQAPAKTNLEQYPILGWFADVKGRESVKRALEIAEVKFSNIRVRLNRL